MNAITSRSKRIWYDCMIDQLHQGVSVSEACEVLGISRTSYYRSLKADPIFKDRVERARAHAASRLTKKIADHDDWRSAAWLLEKLYPEEWGSVKDKLRMSRCTCGAAKRIKRAR